MCSCLHSSQSNQWCLYSTNAAPLFQNWQLPRFSHESWQKNSNGDRQKKRDRLQLRGCAAGLMLSWRTENTLNVHLHTSCPLKIVHVPLISIGVFVPRDRAAIRRHSHHYWASCANQVALLLVSLLVGFHGKTFKMKLMSWGSGQNGWNLLSAFPMWLFVLLQLNCILVLLDCSSRFIVVTSSFFIFRLLQEQ